MLMTLVNSSNLASVGYDHETDVLEVEFRNGGRYRYEGVPKKVYEALMKAESKGQYFHSQVMPKYKALKI